MNHREDFHHAMALALRESIIIAMDIIDDPDEVTTECLNHHLKQLLNRLSNTVLHNAHDRLMILEIYDSNYKLSSDR